MKIPSKQKGSALVLAVFVIVVVTLLGAALVRMMSSNAETIAYEVIGTRSLQAAKAGAQKKMSELFPLLPNNGQCLGAVEYDFSAIKGLENCKAIDVSCGLDATVNGISYYTITSTGECDVGDVFTTRKIEISARVL
jgi:MSHA biogenesis protein MshP